jgi:colanic acid/amylovoran biosynthesis glycosyltransferase
MVGTGPLFEDTKKLISQLALDNEITLTGVLKSAEIRELMKRMRAFVQHSVTAVNGDKEGTPVTVLEARLLDCLLFQRGIRESRRR